VPAVPGFVVMELVQDARNRGHIQQALNLVQPLEMVWPSEADCRVAPDAFITFRLSHGLGLIDALIAACAVGLNATLFTFNKKHFRFTPNLTVAEPYRR
jgi:predicted nucleic acid-binding protein